MKGNSISTQRLAKICGVSQGTVDRALNNRAGISEKTKEYILSVAREYGYRPNKRSDSLQGGKSGLVGIIVFDLWNEYFSELVMCLEKELRKRGCYSLVMFSDSDMKTEKECIEAMYDAGVDGIVLCPINDGKEFSEYLQSWKIPIVTVGNKVEGIKHIGIDFFSAMKDIVENVTAKGFKKVIYYSVNEKDANCNAYAPKKRLEGFWEAANGFNNVEFKVVFSKEECIKAADEESAVIAYNDSYALELVFSDVKAYIIGFDGIPSVYKYKMPITTVTSDKESLTRRVVNYILNPTDEADEHVGYTITQ